LVDETTKKSYTPPEAANRAMLLDRLGSLYLGHEQYPLAVEAYRQITPLTKDTVAVTVQIVETYRAAKDFESAQREVETALKKSQDIRLKIEHANVLADRGKVDEAAAEIKSVMNGENDLKVLFSLAQILEKGKRWNDMAVALDQAEKLAKSKEEQESVHFMRGAMYERQKKFEPAEAEFRKVLALNPESASALNYLGYMLADHGMKLDEANAMVKKALDLDPENGAYLDSLAWVYYRQGKFTEAQGLLERALEKIKTDPTVHDHLGDVYIKLGKTKEAITQWQASLKGFESGSQAEVDPDEMASVSRKLENARVKLAKESHK
jgi:tetratricopeptide (TPR) repeat protein